MQVCEHCGRERDQFDRCGNEVWNCPNDCDFEKFVEKGRNEEAAKSDEQIAAEAEDMLNGLLDQAEVKHTHCWTSMADGSHCPGKVERTSDSQDGSYGHFCPVCGHSLRYHPHYGEGCPGDMALKG
jgi:hypothetical protein